MFATVAARGTKHKCLCCTEIPTGVIGVSTAVEAVTHRECRSVLRRCGVDGGWDGRTSCRSAGAAPSWVLGAAGQSLSYSQ
eukprot:SAG11_NODE_10588_length_819_cov_0.715278_1_plen_80_part_10